MLDAERVVHRMAAAVRALAIVCVLASVASADMEMAPPPVHGCMRGTTWSGIEKCLDKIGKRELVRDFGSAKLVRLVFGPRSVELVLYVSRDKSWQLGGVYDGGADTFEVLSAEPLVVGKHTGYRIDIGEITHMGGSPDGVHHGAAVFMVHRVLLCGGDGWNCTNVAVACDVLVRGVALWSFHGGMTIADNQVVVAGSRANSEPFCTVPERQFLGWSQ